MNEQYIYRKIEKKDIDKILDLWNDEIGFIFPISNDTLSKKTFECKYIVSDGCFGAFIEDTLVGFIFVKMWDNNPIILKYENVGWISLIYVSKKYRQNGIGKNLLAKAEEILINKGVEFISVGADIDNFFPGIPCDFDNLTPNFFENNGYYIGRYTHDLILRDLQKYNSISNNINNNNYEIKFIEESDKEEIIEFMKRCFFGRWYWELIDYFEKGQINREYLIVKDKNKVIAFVRANDKNYVTTGYNITWKDRFSNLAGIGPLGVDKDYRGKGIAKMMIDYTLLDLKKRGINEVIIDWTGIMTFYQQFGFEVWKCYTYISKQIK